MAVRPADRQYLDDSQAYEEPLLIAVREVPAKPVVEPVACRADLGIVNIATIDGSDGQPRTQAAPRTPTRPAEEAVPHRTVPRRQHQADHREDDRY